MSVFGSRRQRVLAGYIAAAVIATIVVMAATSYASQQAGINEAVNAAKDRTLLYADVLSDKIPADLSSRDATRRTAADVALDGVVRDFVKSAKDVIRVKIWTPDGTIVYSDKRELWGREFALEPDEADVLLTGKVEASASDPSKPENIFEQDQGRVLQVYAPMRATAAGDLLFEVYYHDDSISTAAHRIWTEFAPILLGGLLLLAAVNLPLAWRLAQRAQRDQEEKAELLQAAVDASEMERSRIAGDLHDGVVQDLSGITYTLDAVADRLGTEGSPHAAVVAESAAHTRSAVSALRSLLIEIYPPNLREEGLPNALGGLLASVRSRGVAARLDVAPGIECAPACEALLFRAAQEALRNVLTHAEAGEVVVSLRREGEHAVLTVTDDGRGVAVDEWRHPPPGHLGLRFLSDLVERAGGHLDLTPGDPRGAVFTVSVPMEVGV